MKSAHKIYLIIIITILMMCINVYGFDDMVTHKYITEKAADSSSLTIY